MHAHTISATQVSRELSDILNKVRYQGQSFNVKKGKEIIATIIPGSLSQHNMKVKDLEAFFKQIPTLEKEERNSFEKDIQKIRSQLPLEKNPWA